MKIKMQTLKRPAYLAAAFVIAVAGVAQGLLMRKAYAFPAGSALVNREIRISDARPDASAVTYMVGFQPATNYAVTGIIVDFCSGANTPIINDPTCVIPPGFTIGGSPSVTVTSVDSGSSAYTELGAGSGGTWTATDHFSNGQTLRLTHNGTGPTINAGTKYVFTINNVHNPSGTGSFYARIVTYTDDVEDVTTYTHSAAEDGASTNEAEDYGGIALSTAAVISISAKVQETLVFCVSGPNGYDGGGEPVAPTIGNGCSSGISTPSLVLGHGTNMILDNTATDNDSAYMQASTNAQSGINIRMKNVSATTCGGLSRNGGTDNCPIAASGASSATIPAGTAALFGARFVAGSGITAASPYNGAASNYGMDQTTAGNNVLSTYGSLVGSSAAPLSNIQSELQFAATATVTTPAGLYAASLSIIATGTF